MSARIEDTHWTWRAPWRRIPEARQGLWTNQPRSAPSALARKGSSLRMKLRMTEWNGAPDPEKLRTYMNLKLVLAEQLRWLMEILKKRGSDALIRRCQELMVKLAEDRFTLAVVGQFKRGKSSLMNAIIVGIRCISRRIISRCRRAKTPAPFF